MNIHELNIQFWGEELTLTNQRILFWKRKKLLVLSDLHMGKSAHFRKNGIALPSQISSADLLRLDNLIQRYDPKEVMIVGDLIHAGLNKEVALFKTFTSKFSNINFTLLIGNHDRLSKNKLKEIGIGKTYHALQIDKIRFAHQNTNAVTEGSIVGHVHPGVRIKMPTNRYMKFPCFVVTANEIILPAFSRFTGLDTENIPENATCYAFYEAGIFEVPKR